MMRLSITDDHTLQLCVQTTCCFDHFVAPYLFYVAGVEVRTRNSLGDPTRVLQQQRQELGCAKVDGWRSVRDCFTTHG